MVRKMEKKCDKCGGVKNLRWYAGGYICKQCDWIDWKTIAMSGQIERSRED